MRVIITAGGTGGHIVPALSVIEKIQSDKNNDVLYIGTTDRMEKDIIPSKGIKYEAIEVYGLTKDIAKDIKNLICIRKAIKRCKQIIKDFKPDVVLAFGGYVTLPVIIAAKKLHIPVALHEQNYIPGKVNKWLGNKCNVIFVSFKDNEKYFTKTKVVYSGNPCGEKAMNAKPMDKTKLGFKKDKKLIIIVMGSLGSLTVNNLIKDFLLDFNEDDKEILFITGKNHKDAFKDLKVKDNIKIVDFVDNLSSLMKNADLLISRAGASTISELYALNLPSILIPSPYVANNHQYYNALELQNKGIGIMIEQKALTKELLLKKVKEILDDNEEYLNMKSRLALIPKLKASTIIYDEVKKLIGE